MIVVAKLADSAPVNAGLPLLVSVVSLGVATLSLTWNIVSFFRSAPRIKVRIIPGWRVDGSAVGMQYRGLGAGKFPILISTAGKNARATYSVAAFNGGRTVGEIQGALIQIVYTNKETLSFGNVIDGAPIPAEVGPGKLVQLHFAARNIVEEMTKKGSADQVVGLRAVVTTADGTLKYSKITTIVPREFEVVKP